jgi:hypothetical protein
MRMVLILMTFLSLLTASGAAAGEFLGLCFHDVRREAAGGDELAMTTCSRPAREKKSYPPRPCC